jgi:hypothetical protein
MEPERSAHPLLLLGEERRTLCSARLKAREEIERQAKQIAKLDVQIASLEETIEVLEAQASSMRRLKVEHYDPETDAFIDVTHAPSKSQWLSA